MKTFAFLSFFVAMAMFTSCDDGEKDTVITISTKYGEMVAILYDKTPLHKANFIKLAKEGYFNGTVFHRVIKDFMIQGGDPDSKVAKPGQPLGNGGPGYTVPAEIMPDLYHEKGALAAARLGDEVNPSKASSGSQFYIVQGRKIEGFEVQDLSIDQQKLNQGITKFVQNPAHREVLDSLQQMRAQNAQEAFQEKIISLIPRIEKETGLVIRTDNPEKVKAYTTIGGYPPLDGGYTVFGKVVKGLEVIDKIAMAQTDGSDRPVEDIAMNVKVEEVPKSKITKLYGIHYPDQKTVAKP